MDMMGKCKRLKMEVFVHSCHSFKEDAPNLLRVDDHCSLAGDAVILFRGLELLNFSKCTRLDKRRELCFRMCSQNQVNPVHQDEALATSFSIFEQMYICFIASYGKPRKLTSCYVESNNYVRAACQNLISSKVDSILGNHINSQQSQRTGNCEIQL